MPHLGEELLLLAIDQNRGRLSGSDSAIHKGLAAAVLCELELRGHIRVRDGLLTACADYPDDPVLAEALGHLRRNQEVRDIGDWIENLPGRMDLAHALAMQLARRGKLRVEHRTILGLFSTENYTPSVPMAASSIRERLRDFLKGRSWCDARSGALAAVATACGLLPACFAADEWSACRSAAEAATASSPIAAALKRSRESAEADAVFLLLLTSVE